MPDLTFSLRSPGKQPRIPLTTRIIVNVAKEVMTSKRWKGNIFLAIIGILMESETAQWGTRKSPRRFQDLSPRSKGISMNKYQPIIHFAENKRIAMEKYQTLIHIAENIEAIAAPKDRENVIIALNVILKEYISCIYQVGYERCLRVAKEKLQILYLTALLSASTVSRRHSRSRKLTPPSPLKTVHK